MCGRYTFRHPERIPSPRELLEQIDQHRENLLVPRYNIAPSQHVLVAHRDTDGAWRLHPATWGFRPHRLPADRKAPINARAETVAVKPMFRGAFRKDRCLVPADGWYEWQPQPQGAKVPHFFRRPDDGVFWFAGLEAAGTWTDPGAADSTLRDLLAPAGDDLIETYAIGRAVNRPQNDGPDLIVPLAAS